MINGALNVPYGVPIAFSIIAIGLVITIVRERRRKR